MSTTCCIKMHYLKDTIDLKFPCKNVTGLNDFIKAEKTNSQIPLNHFACTYVGMHIPCRHVKSNTKNDSLSLRAYDCEDSIITQTATTSGLPDFS
jgi:hypothetical protein